MEQMNDLLFQAKQRNISILRTILNYDIQFTKNLRTVLLKYIPFKALEMHSKVLEISCHGLVWLSLWMVFTWLINNEHLYQMQMNMLFGLIFDIILIALLKAGCRRRRPTKHGYILSYGPDKFSFPSGHASRAFFISMFFICLYPVPKILWTPILIWASSVSISRLLSQRHFVLDIFFGILIGVIESYFISLLWLDSHTALLIIKWISND